MKQYQRAVLWLACGVFLLVAGVGGAVAAAGEAKAPDKAKIAAAMAFFKGKSIEFVVPYGPGGGYDAKARMMQRFMEKYLPGARVLVKNMPGAGSMFATNQLYVAKPNGLTIAILSGVGIAANQIAGSPIIKYDVTKFTYLGRVSAERRVLIAGLNSKVKDLDSLLKPSGVVKQGLTGPGSGAYAVSQIVLNALGFPREEVIGYQSSAEKEMGIIRGEADISLSTQGGMELARRKEVRVIFQLSPDVIEGFEKIPNLFTKDVAKLKLSEGQLRRLQFASDLMALGYIIGAPPNLPPERAWVLEEAVQKTLRDPDFVAFARKSVEYNIDPLTGREVSETMNRIIRVPPDVKAEMQQLMKAK